MNFLLEIGTEEIPAAYLKPYANQLQNLFANEFKKLELAHGEITTAYTPRRLAFFCENLAEEQPTKNVELKGPPEDIAFKDGAPTKAAEAFAKKCGRALDNLQTKAFGEKKYLFANVTQGGGKTTNLLPELIISVIRKLKSPKSMRWEDKPTVFARPIRWLVALFGETIIPADLDGLVAGNFTYGHRFISPGKIELKTADFKKYKEKLKSARVILEAAEREKMIVHQLIEHGAREEKIDKFLVETCANLVEWPNVIRGSFPKSMLELPEVVLENALKKHQKSFLIYDENGKVNNGFLSVANNDLDDEDLIREGYERVILARLDDAKFFYDEDKKTEFAARVESLKNVVFQNKLGSYFDKTLRISELAESIAKKIEKNELAETAKRAAFLSRADLTTAMVYEFPNLQGIMGNIYAREIDGESENVCQAIEEMYQPRGADDSLPKTLEGALVSVADRIDTLVGCCSVGLGPTGSADPYALRRQSLGMLKTIIAHNFHFSLKEILEEAAAKFNLENSGVTIEAVLQIIKGRFETVLKENSVRYDVINAVLATDWDDVANSLEKAKQIMNLIDTDNFKKACTVVERCHNITKSAELSDTNVDENLFEEKLEKELWAEWMSIKDGIVQSTNFVDCNQQILSIAGGFADKLNLFFDEVRVNAENEKLRTNRLKLVRSIRDEIVKEIADLSQIVFEEK